MSKKIEISISSLVSLKAELARKQEEVNRAKSDAKNSFAHLPPQPKKQTVFTRKNAGVDSRNARDSEEIRKDEDELKKSRVALEAKSKLYDKLSQQPSSSETEDRQFLVDFEQKSREDQQCLNTADPEEEVFDDEEYSNCNTLDPSFDWVEYVDCLGRTKTCLRQDLAFVKEKDAKLAESLSLGPEPVIATEKEEEPAAQPELVSAAAIKREQMRQKWEEQELQLRDKMDVHYQDVLFDEARAHGVGYYGFSSDEAERRTQQEALIRLRQETAAKQQLAQEARQRRQQQLAARLKAARNRQRARLGLPPEEDEPETPAPEKEEEEEEPSAPETAQSEEIPEKTADLPKKIPQVRPWDIGKLGVPEHQVLSQQEWVKMRREDRPQEFAPPATYVEDTAPSGRPQKSPRKWTSKKLFQKKQPDASQALHEEDEPAPPDAYLEDMALLGPEPTMFFTTKRQKVAADASGPSCSAAQPEQKEDQAAARTGVEIAPPPTYEYYGPSGSTLRKDMNKQDMENAIVAGLRYLRKHAEDKEARRAKGMLPIL